MWWTTSGLSCLSRVMIGVKSLMEVDRKSTRLNSSHSQISYAVFCLKKKKKITVPGDQPGQRDVHADARVRRHSTLRRRALLRGRRPGDADGRPRLGLEPRARRLRR